MSEITYYEDQTVHVSSESVKIASKRYQTSEISAVKVWMLRSDPYSSWIWPLLLVVLAAGYLYSTLQTSASEAFWAALALAVFIIGGITWFLVMTIPIVLKKMKFLYVIRVQGSFGDDNVLASEDQSYIRSLADAMNLAIAKKPSGDC
jgi:uncharacterized protein DUF6232